MQTIATLAELEALINQTPNLYVRWSHGPEADAANGWVSRNWCRQDVYDDEGQVIGYNDEGYEEDGLSVASVLSAAAIVRWRGEVHGETCYLLTGREVGLCSDGEPLITSPEPIAYVADSLIGEVANR